MEVRILEDECIGCGACVPVCSTGAITFDDDEMKAIVARDECVGCEDCIPMCAVDAIVPEAVEGDGDTERPAAAKPSDRARPSAASARPDNGGGATSRAVPGGSGLPGGPDLPGRDVRACGCDDESFDLGSWRPGKGSLRRALKRRLRRRAGR